MNLHIAPDSNFINKFYDNLEELGITGSNKIIVRSNDASLRAVKRDLPFAPLYSSRFNALVGNTLQYEKVFIHYFTPLLYRWVATHDFKELNWMVWGGDLYNLPGLDELCYEPITLKYVRQDWSLQTKLYDLKVFLTQRPFRQRAYAKVKNILTWMSQEYKFVMEHLPVEAAHQFFFYENQVSYEKLEALSEPISDNNSLRLLIGNSGSPTNNHLDAVQFLENNRVSADLFIPVSYGDARYISFLRKNVKYTCGKVEFIDRYMMFEAYVKFISSMHGMVMNTVRPQGYGNILMLMYLGKPVFFHPENISLTDLNAAGLLWKPIEALKSFDYHPPVSNKEGVTNLLSHNRLLHEYSRLFTEG